MKVENTGYNISFTSGLSNFLLLKEKLISPTMEEQRLKRDYGITADFAGNKSVALANNLCANIFNQLSKMLKFDIPAPPYITVYKKNQLIDNDTYSNFCIMNETKVLKNKNKYPSGSIFFKNFKNLKQLDEMTEIMFKNNQISSNHFLAPIIHEWLHNIHLNIICNKYGTNGNLSDILSQKTLSAEECNIINKELGSYAAKDGNQYFEIFSELYTQLICQSLSKNSKKLTINPLDLIKLKSNEFQQIINKLKL